MADGLRFWFYGQNTGDEINLQLLDNRAPDPGPAGWVMRFQAMKWVRARAVGL